LGQRNREWCQHVFPEESAPLIMSNIITDCLSSLEPSLEFCTKAAVKLESNTINFLIDIKAKTDRFVEDIRAFLEGNTEKNLRDLGKIAFLHYKPYIQSYGELESQALITEVSSWTAGGKDTIEEIHSLSSAVCKQIDLYKEAAQRCTSLTKGVGFVGLSLAIKSALDKHLDRYRKLMRRLEKRRTVVDDDWSVLQHCLAAIQTTGDLIMQLEELDMNLSLQFLEATRGFLGPEVGESVLDQHHVFLLDEQGIEELTELYVKVTGRSGASSPLLQQSVSLLNSVSGDLQKTTFTVMFHPISTQLEKFPDLDVWEKSSGRQTSSVSLDTELPEFSFSPQEYITQTGEYLMTLPQHLEPYMSGDTSHLSRAFRSGQFPGSQEIGDRDSPVDFILGCIAASTCHTYLKQLSRVPVLSNNSARQLGVDIGYLGDILEDLGHPLTNELVSTSTLLKINQTNFKEESSTCPVKVVQLVRAIRGLQ